MTLDWQPTPEAVREKLGLQPDELEALFAALPSPRVGGPDGRRVAADIRRRFNLPDHLLLGEALREAGIFTPAEAAWLDDAGPA